ncbi:MAG TPA: FAD-dependent oxidoreductase, partial [Vicinamibacterales bacterium]|nr:FAD-dependent oxidoreductase [Vicinamibacterales bacterium]
CDGQCVFTCDDLLQVERLPRSLAVVGAGVIGLEYACIFAALGVRVTLIDARTQLLPFVDREIIEALVYHLRANRATLHLGEKVSSVESYRDDHGNHVRLSLASGKQVVAEKALYSVGRRGATDALDLEAAGVGCDDRGRLRVNEHYQTEVAHIYAVGDVIGFPSLASTSMEQGRLAACHAFGVPAQSLPELFPYGIFTVPGMSMVGKTEEQLTEQGVAYEVGRAQYREIARGQILGDQTGLLKLIFHRDTRLLLGVHIIGAEAAELVHIGQAVLALGGKIDYFVDTVFNYPTLAECYKTAAFDGVNRLNS